jgi:hypothetical protein
MTSPSATSQMPSKGPPPLPNMAAPTSAPHEGAAMESVFEEGIDGRAESLPPSGHDFALDGQALPVRAESDSWAEDEWFEAEVEGHERQAEHEQHEGESENEAIEAPTRRRRVARVGLAYGAIVALAIASVAAFVNPRRDARRDDRLAALDSRPTHIEAATSPLVAVAPRAPLPGPGPAPAPLTAARLSPRPPARATTASAAAAAQTKLRAVVRKGSLASPATRPASKSPKASRARETRPLPPSAPRAAPTRSHR